MTITINSSAGSNNAATAQSFNFSANKQNPPANAVVAFIGFKTPTGTAVTTTRVTWGGQDVTHVAQQISTDNLNLRAYVLPYDAGALGTPVTLSMAFDKSVPIVRCRCIVAAVNTRNPVHSVANRQGSGSGSSLVIQGNANGMILDCIAGFSSNLLTAAALGGNQSLQATVLHTSASLVLGVSSITNSWPGAVTASWASMTATTRFAHIALTLNEYNSGGM